MEFVKSGFGNAALIAGQNYPVMRDYIYYYFKKAFLMWVLGLKFIIEF